MVYAKMQLNFVLITIPLQSPLPQALLRLLLVQLQLAPPQPALLRPPQLRQRLQQRPPPQLQRRLPPR